MRPRRTFTRSATCAALHLVFGTFLHPLPTLRCTTSPLAFEAQPLSSSPDLLGSFLPQGRKLYKTRAPDATLQNLHAPFRRVLPSLTLCRHFVLHCLVLSLPVRSLLLECTLPCPGYCACLVLSSMSDQTMFPPCLCFLGSPWNVLVLVLVYYLGEFVELSCVMRLPCIVVHLPCLCVPTSVLT